MKAISQLSPAHDRFKDVGGKFLGQRFESKVPTVIEHLSETLIINREDQTDEEFYSFSNHHLFGAHFRSNVLLLIAAMFYVPMAQAR